MPKRGRDLYVMQAADGRIKIGRSQDPERRRHGLELALGIPLSLLLVLKGKGPEEGRVKAACADHHLLGEWFVNCREMRQTLREAVGQKVEYRFF